MKSMSRSDIAKIFNYFTHLQQKKNLTWILFFFNLVEFLLASISCTPYNYLQSAKRMQSTLHLLYVRIFTPITPQVSTNGFLTENLLSELKKKKGNNKKRYKSRMYQEILECLKFFKVFFIFLNMTQRE